METIVTWYQSGGPMMLPLALVGTVAALVLGERIAYVIRQSRVHARPFMERVISLVRLERVDEAIALCAQHDSALPDLGLVILRARNSDEHDLRNVAEASSHTVVRPLTRRSVWLPALAITAVLLGVLGAIMNVHDSMVQAARAAESSPLPVFAAIAYAMRPLGAGVMTAIPLVLGHAYVASSSQRLVALLDEFAVRLVNALVDRPDVRLGHR